MLTKIEALNYRALRYISQEIAPFHVLIGPNASGKSTFLDVVAFIGDMFKKSEIQDAVRERTFDFRDLTWMREHDWFELAIESDIPHGLSQKYERLRYEVRLGVDENTGEITLLDETLWFTSVPQVQPKKLEFPQLNDIPIRLTKGTKYTPKGWRKIVNKTSTGNDYFKSETTDWRNNFRLGPKRSALANLMEDQERFPAATWFKRYISESVQKIMLNSEALRRPSPPQSPKTFLPDGSNLPWVIYELERKHPELLQGWVQHVQTALPNIKSIQTIERPEDRHRYLVVQYQSGLQAPSWIVSDGTLRMLALTLLAYLPDLEGLYLIEEPENGIHPQAVETVFQALSNTYNAQIFLATHSPVILSMAQPADLLCFDLTDQGETDIVRGDEHPRLVDWQGEVSLSTLYAAGVLG